MTWLGQLLSRWALVALMAAVLPLSAAAQTIGSDCRELQNPDVAEQVELCTAHKGCWLVVKAAKVCAAAKNFIDRLGTALGDGVQTLFGRRKEIQPEHLWDAVQTDDMRRIETLPGARAKSEAIRDTVAKAPKQATHGQLPNGTSYAYYGETKNGVREGPGSLYLSDGRIMRGQWVQGELQGLGEKAAPFLGSGVRDMGELVGGQITGPGYRVTSAGTVVQGRFMKDELSEGSITRRNGEREEGQFVNGRLAEGSKYAADGSLSEKGSFRDGQLYVGERYANNGQVVASINRPRDQMEHARALQTIAADRQAAELAQKAAAEQRFRDSLSSGNAGQLFALADELKERGEADRARQALRALVTRFPDHPLAATAARQMAPAPAASPAAGTGAAAAPANPGARAGGGSDRCRRALSALWDKTMARAATDNVTFAPGVAGRFEIRLNELALQFLSPCRGEADTDREIENIRRGIEQLKRFCTPERLARDYPQRDGSGGYRVPDHCSKEYVSPAVERWFTIYREEYASAQQQLAGGIAPAASGCEPDPQQLAAYEAAMASLPGGSPTLQIRGAIVGIDLHIRSARACQAPASRIAALENQRAQALRTCRQIASRDNCEESPFR